MRSYRVLSVTGLLAITCVMSAGCGGGSGGATPPWTGTIQLGVEGAHTYGNAVNTDADGNLYLTGATDGALDGNGLVGTEDMFLTKYNRQGNIVYTRQSGVAGQSTSGASVVADADSNVYVVGVTSGGLDGNTPVGTDDFFLIKYNSNGVKLYTKQMGVTGASTVATAVTTDANGNVYVAGYTHGTFPGNVRVGMVDYFVSKFNSSGDPIFTRQMGWTGRHTFGDSIAVDANGNVYVAGETSASVDGGGMYDCFLTKLDADGGGVYAYKIFTQQLGVVGRGATGKSVTVDASGNVYVSGSTTVGLYGNLQTGLDDLFLIKFDSNGNNLYTRQMGVASKRVIGKSVAVDEGGSLYLAGYTDAELDGNTLTGVYDFFLVKYRSDDGVKVYTRLGGSLAAETYGNSVVADANGNIYVAGSTTGGLAGNIQTGASDLFVDKFNEAGVP